MGPFCVRSIGHIADISIYPLLTIEREGRMAFAQKRGEWYRVVFHFNGKRYRKCLKTQNEEAAEAVAGGVKRTLMMLEQGLLQIPPRADIVSFILSGGHEVKQVKEPTANGHLVQG